MQLAGSKFIDLQFPGRHRLVAGDSQLTLPKFMASHAHLGRFVDCFFVDGGHSEKCCWSDLGAAAVITRPKGVIICDEVVADSCSSSSMKSWEIGPTRAWRRARREGIVDELGIKNRMAWGRPKTD